MPKLIEPRRAAAGGKSFLRTTPIFERNELFLSSTLIVGLRILRLTGIANNMEYGSITAQSDVFQPYKKSTLAKILE